LRLKHHDSVNPSIAEAGRNSQRLDACSALREAGCGFFAASFVVSGRFLCKGVAAAESGPGTCRFSAINNDPRLMRRS
jgi:hypothetical protein